jgi:hypothetical protein
MKARVQAWTKRNPVRAAIVLNLVMIFTTALFTVIAFGPDSLLDKDCSGTGRHCVDSHGADVAAVGWVIASGVITVLILGRTIWAAKTGRLKKPDETEEGGPTSPR